jgi:hypothetical protein
VPRHAPAEYHDGLTVAKTFALAIEEAGKLHPAAEPLIVHAALLVPEPIPLFLFAEAREKFGEPLATALAGDGLDEAVAALRAFALVDREVIMDDRDPSIATGGIRLHRLVREVAAARREGEARDQSRRALVAALAAVYPDDAYNNPASWPSCAPLTPHLLASCETEMADAAANAECADLLNRARTWRRRRFRRWAFEPNSALIPSLAPTSLPLCQGTRFDAAGGAFSCSHLREIRAALAGRPPHSSLILAAWVCIGVAP